MTTPTRPTVAETVAAAVAQVRCELGLDTADARQSASVASVAPAALVTPVAPPVPAARPISRDSAVEPAAMTVASLLGAFTGHPLPPEAPVTRTVAPSSGAILGDLLGSLTRETAPAPAAPPVDDWGAGMLGGVMQTMEAHTSSGDRDSGRNRPLR